MPILKNAKKALRASKRKAQFNKMVKSHLKTATDKMKKSPTQKQLSETYGAIDKARKRNIIHANKAGRLKAQMNKLISK